MASGPPSELRGTGGVARRLSASLEVRRAASRWIDIIDPLTLGLDRPRQPLDAEVKRAVDVAAQAEGPGELHVEEAVRPRHDRAGRLERMFRACELRRRPKQWRGPANTSS